MEAGFLQEGDQTGLERMSSGLKKKKGHEWDLNDWRWDSNMFLATPSSNADSPSGCSSRELGRAEEGISFGVADKRRRVSTVDNHEGCSNAVITNGDHDMITVRRGQSSEEERPANATRACSSSAPSWSCQVDGCHADLGNSRDYHKRHKVCEMHTKSTLVRIKNVEHRFCQQCSRFHLLQEFDEGKKSCRSRLAKHNGRRRKAPAQAEKFSSENHSLTNTLLLLLRQLSGQDSGSSTEQINGPNHLVNLLKNLAAIAGTQAYQNMLKNASSAAISSNAGNYLVNGFTIQEQTGPPIPGTESSAEEPPVKRHMQNFDLNDAYVEEDESRTDKIVFKLFGKEPNDFPSDIRAQILNWLSHYPSDLESYIRPGCVILTIYLRLPNWMWDKINVDPAPWIENLVSISPHGFWKTGWFYARVQDSLTLSCNGRLMLVSPWQPVIGDKHQILSVTPIAAACYSTANFSVRGFNIVQPTTRLVCIFGGKYLIQEATEILCDDTTMQQGPQCLTFSCSFHSTSGRGFIEIEDHDQSSLSFPFVVAEESVCSEIRMLEEKLNIITFGDTFEEREVLMTSRSRALEFLHEIGWFLQRSHTRATSKTPQHCIEVFSVARFRWLLSFAIEQEWCYVLKKLLDTLFQGNIDLDVPSLVEFVLGEGLVFTAVNKRSKPLVDFLLRYTTNSAPVDSGAMAPVRFLFTPDVTGPSNMTPLHIAATITDAAAVLDALTDDPQQRGTKTWKNARDATGYTPEDYARRRGHLSYIQMVENKTNSRIPEAHVFVSMTSTPSSRSAATTRREIGTLKLLKHPNVVRLHEVAASKTKIYMVLEYVNGGELFDKIAIKGKLLEHEGRRLFQQLIDGLAYCHDKGVYHRDLKPENVLVDRKGNIKISDFGLSALPQHLGNDGLLHTTCGSPNYIAPEVLQNRGYDGSLSDIWSCGVILYVMLVGYLPFDDRNLVVLYQKIFKGDMQIPLWLSPAAQDLIRKILEPNPMKRINISGIKEHEWFLKNYVPTVPYDDDEDLNLDSVFSKKELIDEAGQEKPTHINAFQLIGMASSLDLSGFFEEEDVSQRKIRFTSIHSPKDLFDKIENVVTMMGFQAQRGHSKLKVMKCKNPNNTRNPSSFLACAEVFELGPSLYVVELKKSHGDRILYRELGERLSDELGVCKVEQMMESMESIDSDLASFDGGSPLSGF